MMAPIIILRLEGSLQSWGERSRFDFRDTNAMPTKSGMIGLIACAMGLKRKDKRIQTLFHELEMGVRADRNGLLLEDFHTVTGERDFLYRPDGKKRVGSPTLLTPRQYLQDACFTVALSGSSKRSEEIKEALQNPVWQTFLGRKGCVPSRPVFETITSDYTSIVDAIKNYPLCNRPIPIKEKYFLCEYDDKSGEAVRRDTITDNHLRNYGFRRIKSTVFYVKGE
jgi:CRISPR system Cascade subunit CasD